MHHRLPIPAGFDVYVHFACERPNIDEICACSEMFGARNPYSQNVKANVGKSVQYLPPHSCLRTFPCSSVTSGSSLIELRRSIKRSLTSVLPPRAHTASHRMSKTAPLCKLLGSSLIRDSQIAAMLRVAASGVELPSRRLWDASIMRCFSGCCWCLDDRIC
jgi:hypothetical protein